MDLYEVASSEPEVSWQMEILENPAQLEPLKIVMLPQESNETESQAISSRTADLNTTDSTSSADQFRTCSHCGEKFCTDESFKVIQWNAEIRTSEIGKVP